MAWVPFKLNSSKRAKGYQPERGWYCVDPDTKVADLSERFDKKGTARKACKTKLPKASAIAGVDKKPGDAGEP